MFRQTFKQGAKSRLKVVPKLDHREVPKVEIAETEMGEEDREVIYGIHRSRDKQATPLDGRVVGIPVLILNSGHAMQHVVVEIVWWNIRIQSWVVSVPFRYTVLDNRIKSGLETFLKGKKYMHILCNFV